MKSVIKLLAVGGLFALTFSCTSPEKIIGNKTGDIAPDIAATDVNGQTVTLSSLRGKVVLLEFWDSQNTVSRRNHMEIQRLYESYQNTVFEIGNGLTIYSFSIDTSKESWISAITADKTTWPYHVCDFKSWDSKAVLDYKLGVTPKYYLIDANGIIIKRNILIPELESILAEYKR